MSTSPPHAPITPVTTTIAAGANPLQRGMAWPTWLREPLLHFVVLGGLLFAADHLLISRSGDPRTIVVGAEVDAQAREVFKASRGQDPNPQELAALRRVWLDNEVLYREGLALQVDKGDPAIRDRVIFKALSVVDANTQLPPVDDKLLHDWFEAHRIKYDEPARLDFQEAVLSGENTEAAVQAFAAALNGGLPGDAQAGLRVFKGRPHANLVQSYSAEFARTLEAATPGEWRALQTPAGLGAVTASSRIARQPVGVCSASHSPGAAASSARANSAL